jgi:hypothetical protein
MRTQTFNYETKLLIFSYIHVNNISIKTKLMWIYTATTPYAFMA